MALDDRHVSARFFTALAALLVVLLTAAALGLSGLSAVDHANNQVFDDNFRTAESTSRLAVDLGRAQTLSLQIVAASEPPTAEHLRAELAVSVLPAVARDITQVLRLHRRDPAGERAQIAKIPGAWQPFVEEARRGALRPGAPLPRPAERAHDVERLTGILSPLIETMVARQGVEVQAASSAHASAHHVFQARRTWLLVVAAVGLLASLWLVRSGLTLRRLIAAQAREQGYGKLESEYIEVLQGAENETEAQELLGAQIERALPGTAVLVLTRNNSDQRLEARTALRELEALRTPLLSAQPRSCLAVRFARAHTEHDTEEQLASCDLCGKLPGASVCEPLLVGGQVIGSVLVNRADQPDAEARRRIHEIVGQAAPVVGNLRNLALAERRAATDALTGLPNHRAVQDTLKRMVAQANRTLAPLASILVDLDHFKDVNDVHGHERGDQLLASVGVALQNSVRESDFVGRYGGEEFLVLLPASDREVAVRVAEHIRGAIAKIRLHELDLSITASAGVAALPQDGGDATTLFRAVDRALYTAKRAGRDRVHVATDERAPASPAPVVLDA